MSAFHARLNAALSQRGAIGAQFATAWVYYHDGAEPDAAAQAIISNRAQVSA